MLGTSDDRFELKLKGLDKLGGFGSMTRQKFEHFGRQYGKDASGEITISIKACTPNLKKASLLDDELSVTESHEFRGINGCTQWVTKNYSNPFSSL